MTSGRQILTNFETAIAGLRTDESRLSEALRSAESEAARLRQERVKAFKALAEVKVDLIAREQFVGELDAAERRAKDLLTRHKQALDAINARREAAISAQIAAEKARHAKAEILEENVEALDRLTAEVTARVRAGAEWQAQQNKALAARKIADEADKKAKVAEADLAEKKKPYEADPIFVYLWQRKFGTSDYAAGNFVRFFDRKVAAFIGFSEARANFHMLNEIPTRLRAHANKAIAAAKQEEAGMSALEVAGLEAAGGQKLIEAVAAARAELEAAERELAGKKAALAALDKQSEAILREGGDGAYQQAVAQLAEADSKLDLRLLQAEALRTATPQDEAIVSRIGQIDQAIQRADEEAAKIRAEMRQLAQRRIEVERVRDNFRREGHDNPFGSFQNGSMITEILGQVIKGAIQGSVLDRVLRDGYRERHHHWEPDFGNRGGGFRFPDFGGGRSSPPNPGRSGGIFTSDSQSGSGWSGGWSDWIGGGGSDSGSIIDSDASGDFGTTDSF